MAATQRVRVKVTKGYTRKTGGNTGYKKCPTCKGTGRVKSR